MRKAAPATTISQQTNNTALWCDNPVTRATTSNIRPAISIGQPSSMSILSFNLFLYIVFSMKGVGCYFY